MKVRGRVRVRVTCFGSSLSFRSIGHSLRLRGWRRSRERVLNLVGVGSTTNQYSASAVVSVP